MTDVERYRMRRSRRLAARKRMDDEESNSANNGGRKGGHGNTRLPYGLCHRYGIEIQKGWQPRDAWDALAGKGVTPGEEFSKRSGRQTTLKTKSATYKNVRAKKTKGGYAIVGDLQPMAKSGYFGKTVEDASIGSFKTKDEVFAYLKHYGITHAIDPDTGEKVNPTKLDVPKVVAKKGATLFTDVAIGTRREKSGRVGDSRGFTLVGKGFDGKKTVLGAFDSPEKAKEYARRFLDCKEEDLRKTKDFREWESKGITPKEDYLETHPWLKGVKGA